MFKWFNMLASVIMAPECKIMNAVAFSRALRSHAGKQWFMLHGKRL
jgi:hypothetical protein